MKESLERMISSIVTQVESLIRIAELVEPGPLLKLGLNKEKSEPVREKYVNTCSQMESQLRNVLKQVQKESPNPTLEAKLTHAINRLEELRKPYI